ncbi:MAG: NAD(P)(+) transhydrogenase (Re/Si-specific) subunit beta, partial [Candidatus Thiodiazotropha taylori]
MEISANTQSIAYLISAVLFILALKGLTHPASARRGNYLGMIGMAIAILATLLGSEVQSYGFIIAGVAAGALIGFVVASRVEMTAMPQLVAALHSFVGMAAVLVAIGTYLNHDAAGTLNPVMMGELSAGIIIGAITFSGSVVAFAELQGLVSGAPVKFKGQHMLNAAIAVATVLLGIHFGMTESMTSLVLMTLLAFILGFTLIIPIGGADMPVIISM